MNCRKWIALILLCGASFLTPFEMIKARTSFGTEAGNYPAASPDFISAEKLKAKLTRDEAVTIIDVRDTQSYLNNNRIKGSIYVKLRRLAYRLTMPPLKDLPRDREVVTYCACPHDEASIHAAQILTDAGFKRVQVLQGGWQMWLKANGQVSARPRA